MISAHTSIHPLPTQIICSKCIIQPKYHPRVMYSFPENQNNTSTVALTKRIALCAKCPPIRYPHEQCLPLHNALCIAIL